MTGQTHCILVVDDVMTNRELAKRMLARHGYEVETVVDGPSALEALESRAYDLVLLDINMPGMDGFEVCRTIRQQQRLAELPVIMLSAAEDSVAMFAQCDAAGATSYMTKPFSMEQLATTVARYLK